MASNNPLYKIKVTNIVDPENFWAQIVTEETLLEFTRKEEDLNTFCQQTGVKEFNVDSLEVGQLILVLSDHWKKWVRAKVALTAEDQEVDVSHIDYGNTEYVDSSQIIADVPEMYDEMNWPMSCYRCKLSSICPIARTYTRRATDDFSAMVLGRTLDGQVVDVADCICVLDILVEEGLDVQSVSDLLIEEGHAKPISAMQPLKAEEVKVEVQGFDVTKLLQQRQTSNNTDEADEEEEEPDIEAMIFRRQISGDFTWTQSDKTLGIGKNYQPNFERHPVTSQTGVPDLPEITFEPERNLPNAQSVEEDEYRVYASEPSTHDAPVVETEKNASITASQGGSVSPKPSHSVKTTHGGKVSPKPVHPVRNKLSQRDSSNSPVRLSRGRGSPAPTSRHRETPPGSRDVSPRPQLDGDSVANQTPAVSSDGTSESQRKTGPAEKAKVVTPTESDNSSQDSGADRARKKKPRPLPEVSVEKLKNEYEWQKYRLTHKLKKIFSRLSTSSLKEDLIEVSMLLYPSQSMFDGLPGPKELYLCIEVALTQAIEDPSLRAAIVQLLGILSADENFPATMSELLLKLQADHVRVGRTTYVRQCAINYCHLLAALFIASIAWDQPARDALGTCLYNTVEKWAVFNKKRNHPDPADLMELYSMCIYTVLSFAGETIEEHQPKLIKNTYQEITNNLLSNDLDRSLKLQMLALCLLQDNKWKTPGVEEPEGDEAVVMATEETAKCDASTDTSGLQPPHYDEAVQTDCQEGGGVRLSRQNSPIDGNPYGGVQQMLGRLNMQELEGFFMKNAIRDTTLAMDFADVKELLKECGFLPGQIYEIKAYLLQNPVGPPRNEQSRVYRPPHSRNPPDVGRLPLGDVPIRSSTSSLRSSPTSNLHISQTDHEYPGHYYGDYDYPDPRDAAVHRVHDSRNYEYPSPQIIDHSVPQEYSVRRGSDHRVQSEYPMQRDGNHLENEEYHLQRGHSYHQQNKYYAPNSQTRIPNHHRPCSQTATSPSDHHRSIERYRSDSCSSQHDSCHERSYSRSTSREERTKYVEYVDAFEEQVSEKGENEVQQNHDYHSTHCGILPPHDKFSHRDQSSCGKDCPSEYQSYNDGNEDLKLSSVRKSVERQVTSNHARNDNRTDTSDGERHSYGSSKQRKKDGGNVCSDVRQPQNNSSRNATLKCAVMKTKVNNGPDINAATPSKSIDYSKNGPQDVINSSLDSEVDISPKRPAVEYVDAFEDETMPGQTNDNCSRDGLPVNSQRWSQREKHGSTSHDTSAELHENPTSLVDYIENAPKSRYKNRHDETSDSYEYPETSEDESQPRRKFNIKIREHKKPAFDPEKAFGGAAKCTVCGSTAHKTFDCPKKVAGFIL